MQTTQTLADTFPVGKVHLGPSDVPSRTCAFLTRQWEALCKHLRIAVIYGNAKSDPGAVIYETLNVRHWKSYEAVAHDIAEALRRLGFRHVFTMPDGMTLPSALRRERIHIAWLNTGGVQGASPLCHTPAMLEMLGIPYIGHNPFNAALLDNKHSFKLELAGLGLPTAPFLTWHAYDGRLNPKLDERFNAVFGNFGGPFIVKPVNGRASQNVHLVETLEDLPDAVYETSLATDNLVLIERFLPGREYCIAVAGGTVARNREVGQSARPFTFSATERVLSADESIFTSMDQRPITEERIQLVDKARSGQVRQRLHDLAAAVYSKFHLETMVRLDIRADERGDLYILEANPKPDLARPQSGKISIVCKGLDEENMDYEDLILSLVIDRLHFLLQHRKKSIGHILDILD